jgi:hypothetical protein
VQKAVFVSDHKVSLGTIFGDQESHSLRILGDHENEVCGVGFAWPQWFCERRKSATDASKRRLTWCLRFPYSSAFVLARVPFAARIAYLIRRGSKFSTNA